MNDRIHYVGSSSTCSGVVDGSLMDLNSSNCLNVMSMNVPILDLVAENDNNFFIVSLTFPLNNINKI